MNVSELTKGDQIVGPSGAVYRVLSIDLLGNRIKARSVEYTYRAADHRLKTVHTFDGWALQGFERASHD